MSSQGIGGIGAKKFCLAHQQHQLPNDYRCVNPDFEAYITNKGFKSAQGIAPELNIP